MELLVFDREGLQNMISRNTKIALSIIDKLCRRLNDLVYRRTSPEKFITFFEGVKKDVAEGQRLSAPPASPGAIEGGLLPSYADFALNEEAADAIRAAARANGYAGRDVFFVDRGFDWGAVPVLSSAGSFCFSSLRASFANEVSVP